MRKAPSLGRDEATSSTSARLTAGDDGDGGGGGGSVRALALRARRLARAARRRAAEITLHLSSDGAAVVLRSWTREESLSGGRKRCRRRSPPSAVRRRRRRPRRRLPPPPPTRAARRCYRRGRCGAIRRRAASRCRSSAQFSTRAMSSRLVQRPSARRDVPAAPHGHRVQPRRPHRAHLDRAAARRASSRCWRRASTASATTRSASASMCWTWAKKAHRFHKIAVRRLRVRGSLLGDDERVALTPLRRADGRAVRTRRSRSRWCARRSACATPRTGLVALLLGERVAGAYKAMGLRARGSASADYLPVRDFMWRNRHRLPLQRGAFLSKEVVIDFGRPPEHLIRLQELADVNAALVMMRALYVLRRWFRRVVLNRGLRRGSVDPTDAAAAAIAGEWIAVAHEHIGVRGSSSASIVEPTAATLHEAAARGMTEEVARLLGGSMLLGSVGAYSFDVDVRGPSGRTALIKACERGHAETARLLIDHGAAVDARHDGGGRRCSPRAWRGSEAARLLINRGADVDVCHDEGSTPPMAAAQGGKTEIVRLLLDSGAKADHQMATKGRGRRSCSRRSGGTSTRRARCARECGADRSVRDADGTTALDWLERRRAATRRRAAKLRALLKFSRVCVSPLRVVRFPPRRVFLAPGPPRSYGSPPMRRGAPAPGERLRARRPVALAASFMMPISGDGGAVNGPDRRAAQGVELIEHALPRAMTVFDEPSAFAVAMNRPSARGVAVIHGAAHAGRLLPHRPFRRRAAMCSTPSGGTTAEGEPPGALALPQQLLRATARSARVASSPDGRRRRVEERRRSTAIGDDLERPRLRGGRTTGAPGFRAEVLMRRRAAKRRGWPRKRWRASADGRSTCRCGEVPRSGAPPRSARRAGPRRGGAARGATAPPGRAAASAAADGRSRPLHEQHVAVRRGTGRRGVRGEPSRRGPPLAQLHASDARAKSRAPQWAARVHAAVSGGSTPRRATSSAERGARCERGAREWHGGVRAASRGRRRDVAPRAATVAAHRATEPRRDRGAARAPRRRRERGPRGPPGSRVGGDRRAGRRREQPRADARRSRRRAPWGSSPCVGARAPVRGTSPMKLQASRDHAPHALAAAASAAGDRRAHGAERSTTCADSRHATARTPSDARMCAQRRQARSRAADQARHIRRGTPALRAARMASPDVDAAIEHAHGCRAPPRGGRLGLRAGAERAPRLEAQRRPSAAGSTRASAGRRAGAQRAAAGRRRARPPIRRHGAFGRRPRAPLTGVPLRAPQAAACSAGGSASEPADRRRRCGGRRRPPSGAGASGGDAAADRRRLHARRARRPRRVGEPDECSRAMYSSRALRPPTRRRASSEVEPPATASP